MSFSSSSDSEDDLNALREINVTPFIDVMLVLLIIFMVAAPLSTSSIPVDLPATTRVPQPESQEPLTVTLKENGAIFILDSEIPRARFTEALKRASNGKNDTRVFLRADKNVNYQSLITIMDLLRDSGFLKVSLTGLESSGAAGESA